MLSDKNNPLNNFCLRKWIYRRIRYIFAILTIGIFYWFIGLYAYWFYFDTKPPIEINEYYLENDAKVEKGGVLTLVKDFDQLRNCESRTERKLVSELRNNNTSSENTEVSEFIVNLPVVVNYSNTVDDGIKQITGIKIPEEVFAGEWTYKSTITYKCNPVGVITVSAPDINFEVVKD